MFAPNTPADRPKLKSTSASTNTLPMSILDPVKYPPSPLDGLPSSRSIQPSVPTGPPKYLYFHYSSCININTSYCRIGTSTIPKDFVDSGVFPAFRTGATPLSKQKFLRHQNTTRILSAGVPPFQVPQVHSAHQATLFGQRGEINVNIESPPITISVCLGDP